MPLSQILAISCFLTGIVMAVFIVGLLVTMRFGQQWIQSIVERFTNPDKNRDKGDNRRDKASSSQQQPQIASSQSLRQRAQSLDFPAPAGNFSAQAAHPDNAYGQNMNPQQPARASLRARDQYPDFNPQAQQTGQTQGFQPNMPSLSASRPYQGLTQPSQAQHPQQQGFQQAPQYPQQQGLTQPSQPQYPQQQGYQQAPQQFQPLRPQAPQPPQMPPQQQGFQQAPQQFQPLRPQQGSQPPQVPQFPQQGFQQQGFQQPQQPQQGGLGEYRPGLNNAPRPDLRTQSQRPIRRDTRRQDNQMDEGGLDGLIDDAGDLLGF